MCSCKPGARLQLHTLWVEWVAKTCDKQLVPEVAASLGMEAATLPDSDDERSEGGTDGAQPGSAADDVAAVEAAKQRLAVGAPAGP